MFVLSLISTFRCTVAYSQLLDPKSSILNLKIRCMIMTKIIIEVWLPITYSDKLVSNLGQVKNKKGTILRLSVCKRSGYIQMVFKINDVYKNIAIHTLVAQAFIPNPENKPFINHKNGIRHDNRVVNLKWATPKENAERKVFSNRKNKTSSRRVMQKTLDGQVVRVWNSICLASNTLEIDGGCISECCSRKRNTAGGWCWKIT